MAAGKQPRADDPSVSSLSNGALLAFIGGFMDGFTYVGHGHVFANAMTGNVVLLGIYAAAGSWQQSLRHLPPIVTFVLGICAARAILLPRFRKIGVSPHRTILLLEIALVGMTGLLPDRTADFWITTSIAFVASLQVETFRMVNGRSFNSTFTTGNLRSLSEGLFDWAFRHNVADARAQAGDFAVICLTFFLGAITGGYTTSHFGNRALFIDLFLLSGFWFRLR